MHLGKYEVLDQIGVGGFGRVLLARDPDAADPGAQLVAIKRLRRAKAQRKGSMEGIVNEARIGSYLSHPNIVRVIELAQVGRDLLLVMEFINGIGLDELLSQQRMNSLALPTGVALQIAIQAGEGLHHAHTALSPDGEPLHIRHRDIKPSNIMVCRRGVVKVMDFGVALTALPRVQTTTGTIKGTLRYLSPEQAQGTREIGPETDQFALALVLAEMLIGRPVYDATQDHQILLRALRGQVGAAIEQAEQVCPGVAPILQRALALKPADRYATTGDLVQALQALQVPVAAGDTLAEWVHRGLEERARLAAEEMHDDGGDVLDPSAESGDIQGPAAQFSDTMPLGWANEQLSAFEASGELAGWELEPGQDPEAPILARTPGDPEGWAMVDEQPDLEWNSLRRSPPSDEWLAAMFAPVAPRTLKKTDLSAEIRLMRAEQVASVADRKPEEVEHLLSAPASSEQISAKEGGAPGRREGASRRAGHEPRREGAARASMKRDASGSQDAVPGSAGTQPAEAAGKTGREPAPGAAESLQPLSDDFLGPLRKPEKESSGGARVRGSAQRTSSEERKRQAAASEAKGGEESLSLPFASQDSSAPSSTAYSVKRPGGDRVVTRTRKSERTREIHPPPQSLTESPRGAEERVFDLSPPPETTGSGSSSPSSGESGPGVEAFLQGKGPATPQPTGDHTPIRPVTRDEAITLQDVDAEGERKGLRSLIRWLVRK